MPCLKQQIEWVKACLAFRVAEDEQPREHEMLRAIIGSLENLQRRVDAEVAARRQLVNADASSCPTCGLSGRGPQECAACRQQRKDEEEL